MATLFLRGETYYVRYYDKFRGRTIHISTKCKNTRDGKVAANRLLKELQAKQHLGILTSFSRKINKETAISLKEGYEAFLMEMELSRKTIEAYNNAVNKLTEAAKTPYIFHMDKNINYQLKQVFDKYNLSQNSRSIYTRALRSLFNYFVKEKFIKENPIKVIPIANKTPKPVPLEDVRKMLLYYRHLAESSRMKGHEKLSITYQQTHDLIKFLAMSGFRISEAIALDWSDVDMVSGIITVHNIKMKREDRIPIIRELWEHLTTMQPREEGRVFFAFTRTQSIKTNWRTMNSRLKFHYTIHQLRKTAASVLANSKVDPVFLKDYIRHRKFQTTLDNYASVNLLSSKEDIDKKVIFNL